MDSKLLDFSPVIGSVFYSPSTTMGVLDSLT